MVSISSSTPCTMVLTATLTGSKTTDATTTLVSPNTNGGMSSNRRAGLLKSCNSSTKKPGLGVRSHCAHSHKLHFLSNYSEHLERDKAALAEFTAGQPFLQTPHLAIFFKLNLQVPSNSGQAGQHSVGCLRDLGSARERVVPKLQ